MSLERLLVDESVEPIHALGAQGEAADSDEELLERRRRSESGI
jgi:hypothetical protein